MARGKSLIKGYKSFYHKYFVLKPAVYQELVRTGQTPSSLVIACSDSRVDPAIVTNASPGDIFVVRNVANLVPNYSDEDHNHSISAALEFSVKGLGVDHIIILGHRDCGGIQALVNEEAGENFPLVRRWMKVADNAIAPEREKVSDESLSTRCEKACIVSSLKNCLSYPFIKEKVDEGSLTLHGWYFDISSGKIYDYHHEQAEFVTMV